MKPKNDKERKRIHRSFAKPSGAKGFYDIYERWNRKDCYVATVTKREIPDGIEVRYDNYISRPRGRR